MSITHFDLRITVDLKKEITEQSKKESRSINNMIVQLIKRGLKISGKD